MLTSLGVKSASSAAIRRSNWRNRCLRTFIRASLLVEIVDAALQRFCQCGELGRARVRRANFPFCDGAPLDIQQISEFLLLELRPFSHTDQSFRIHPSF